jgi:hypothetical protein
MRASLLRTPLVVALVAGGAVLGAVPTLAQTSSCRDVQTFMGERQKLIQQLNNAGGKDKKLDPGVACSAFGKLVTNGETGLKWIEANKDWCQIPDQFAQSFREDHDKMKKLRGEACKIAAKAAQIEKEARRGSNPFGGGLTGEYKIPQGAL